MSSSLMDLQAQLCSGENVVSNINNEGSIGEEGQTENGQSMMRSTIEWLNEQLPNLNLPLEASLENLRACLLDGTTLCHLLNRLSPGAVEMGVASEPNSASVESFLSTLDKMGLTGFEVSDLEQYMQGSMIKVLECLQELRLSCNADSKISRNHARKRWNVSEMDDGLDHSQLDTQHSTKSGQDK